MSLVWNHLLGTKLKRHVSSDVKTPMNGIKRPKNVNAQKQHLMRLITNVLPVIRHSNGLKTILSVLFLKMKPA